MRFIKTPLAIAIVCALGVSASTAYATAITDDMNNTFDDREILASGVRLYEGELSPGTAADPFGGATFFELFAPDVSFSGTLDAGAVDAFEVTGISSTDSVMVIIDNTPYNPAINDMFFLDNMGSAPDTLIGIFDESGVLQQTNDDGGFNNISGIVSPYIQPNGDLDLKVTGFTDSDFNGSDDDTTNPHIESGDYEIGVYINRDFDEEVSLLEELNPEFFGEIGGEFGGGMIEGDVDFIQFSGLNSGEMFRVELFSDFYTLAEETPGGMIGLFDNNGVLLAADRAWDNDKVLLGGIVPTSGTINIAVTGIFDDGTFGDRDAFDGTSYGQESGFYDLVLETFALGSGGDISDIVVLPNPDFFTEEQLAAICGTAALSECFVFGGLEVEAGEIVNLDPHIATGYDYVIVNGPGSFIDVVLPSVGSDSDFIITAGGIDYNVTAGSLFTFAQGITSFSVSGIDPLEGLDSSDPLAFVTVVSFSQQGTYNLSQIAQTHPHANSVSVSEPGMLALFGAGLVGLGFTGRKRKKA